VSIQQCREFSTAMIGTAYYHQILSLQWVLYAFDTSFLMPAQGTANCNLMAGL
jgi:hypothetical protein